MIKGQLVEIIHQEKETENHWWEYGVITEKYDDMVHIITQNGNQTMYHLFENEGEKSEMEDWMRKTIKVVELFKDGVPVMAKKTIFGNYKFQ